MKCSGDGRDQATRYYQHRFVWFDETNTLRGVSRPFFFHKKGVEFAAGLAWHPDGKRLLISYSVADSEAWIATVDAAEVRGVLEDVEHLPSGAPGMPAREAAHTSAPATCASKDRIAAREEVDILDRGPAGKSNTLRIRW